MLHTYRSRQFHRTLNGENPSSSFRDMSSAKCGLHRYQIWQVIGPWASPYGANGQMTLTLHTYRSWQFHRTLNGENLSSGFRDMGSAKCGLHWYQIWQVIGLWASPPGANGQLAMTLHKFRSRQVHRTSNGVNPSNGFRVMGSARSAARPDRDDNTPPARRAEGQKITSEMPKVPKSHFAYLCTYLMSCDTHDWTCLNYSPEE